MTRAAAHYGGVMAAEPSPWRPLLSLAGVGMTLVIATAGATVGGYFVDRWLGSTPWFTLIGIAVGIAAGSLELVRSLRRSARQEHDGT
jgi:ATP synthase protein I